MIEVAIVLIVNLSGLKRVGCIAEIGQIVLSLVGFGIAFLSGGFDLPVVQSSLCSVL